MWKGFDFWNNCKYQKTVNKKYINNIKLLYKIILKINKIYL
jgi:hypothetical protein